MLTSYGQENGDIFLRITSKGDSFFMGGRFFFFPNNIHRQLTEANVDDSMTGQRIRKWHRKFEICREINHDDVGGYIPICNATGFLNS
jgi:hypothetical protein